MHCTSFRHIALHFANLTTRLSYLPPHFHCPGLQSVPYAYQPLVSCTVFHSLIRNTVSAFLHLYSANVLFKDNFLHLYTIIKGLHVHFVTAFALCATYKFDFELDGHHIALSMAIIPRTGRRPMYTSACHTKTFFHLPEDYYKQTPN